MACALALPLACAALCCHAQAPAAPSVVEPGAPGHSNKVLTAQTTGLHLLPPTVADIRFMQGMIMHHGQAVEMCDLVKTHTTDPKVLDLGRRIGLSQATEMAFMTRWLTDRGQPIDDPTMKMGSSMAGMDMGDMKGMDMSGMKMDGLDMDMPPMPGMLTHKQMDALRAARGPEFDRLFLTGMMQHHGGALTMVRDLFNQPSAVQDPTLFDFATDVDNTQTAEIDLMHRLLVQRQPQ
jgi:uncharacterized protein (DUF305 family)